MSLLLLDVALIGGGIALGRWMVGRIRSRHPDEGGAPAQPLAPKVDPFEGLPCRLGDVVVRSAERDEVWLAGALVLSEERPVAVLFIAPEVGGDRALFARVAAGPTLVWLSPLPPDALRVGAEPPHVLEHDGMRFERVRRLPVAIAREGTGAPSVGVHGIVAEYAGAGSERIVVLAAASVLAWRGTALADADYEVLPGDGGRSES